MSTVVQGILLAVIGVLLFGLIIFIHEFGHFFTAKLSHVCVNEFSIGMGPKLFSFTRGETQYSLRLLPIGGYCAMEGEDEKSDDPRAFGNRPVWQRMIVVAAGGIMNTEIILLEQDITVDEAISLIRRGMEEDMEIPYYAYVVDEDDKLVGVFSLRDLMLSKPGTILRDSLHDQDVIAVRYDTSSEEVARRMSHYNFMAMPVVDYEGRLLGVATYDDILDIMQDEASADLLGMVGAGQDETVDTPWLESVQIRLPWLIVNMVTSMMSAFVVYMFEGSIAGMALLAVLMPMVANQAGNTGQQALAVMIRQLATEKFDRKRAWIAVLREGKIGIASGVIMAMLACVGVWFTSSSPELGMVMGAALMGDMLLGALAGGSIPLIFRAVGRDPAQASSIFLTAITDSAGFFIFLGLATAFLL